MLPLPILNVRLSTCPEDWQQITPVAQGHHCAQCNRTVLDFTRGTQAELDAAFQDSPDGRVCGRFRTKQLAPTPPLRPKLRRFLVALVLVCGLGLTGQEAVAQVLHNSKTPVEFVAIGKLSAEALGLPDADFNALTRSEADETEVLAFGMVMEQLPEFKGGQAALASYLRENLRYPEGVTASGKVLVTFLVTETGQVKNTRISKGLEPLLDKEAVRVVSNMPPWKPGRQANRPSEVQYTLPITFTSQ